MGDASVGDGAGLGRPPEPADPSLKAKEKAGGGSTATGQLHFRLCAHAARPA